MAKVNQKWCSLSAQKVLELCLSNLSKGLSSKEALIRLNAQGSFCLHGVPEYKLPFMIYDVVRDGVIKKLALNKLVFGDIIYCKKGDYIPADIRLLNVNNLVLQEDNISGVSAPISKNTFTISQDILDNLVPKNMLYAKSYVLNGRAIGIIVGSPAKSLNQIKVDKKFAKKGLFMPKKVAHLFITSNLIIFDGLQKPSEIIASVQNIAIAKQIPCIYLFPHNLVLECEALLPEANVDINNMNKLISFFDTSTINKAKIVTNLNKNHKTLYIYGGVDYEPAASIARCDLLLQSKASSVAVVDAKIIATKLTVNNLAGFLYNKK